MKCDYCDGKGIKNNKRCWNCYGTGQRFEIRIEPQQPVVFACGDHIGYAERIGLSQDGAICGNCATGRSDYDARMELDTLKARLEALAAELPARTWEQVVCADEDAEQTWSQIRPLLTGLIAAELRALLRKKAK